MTSSRTKKQARGFTLIELLVVVSIISLLSSVILASLNESRGRAQDTKVVSQLLEMRNVAELNYSGSDYGVTWSESACDTLTDAFTDAGFNNSGVWPAIDGTSEVPVCFSDAQMGQVVTQFSLWHSLNDSSGWCVDSYGSSMRLASAPNWYDCRDAIVLGPNPLAYGELCTSGSECASLICGYTNQQTMEGDLNQTQCTDGIFGVYCTLDDQCASNSCDTMNSVCNQNI